MAAAPERVKPGMRIVTGDHFGSRWMPAASDPHAHCGVCLKVADVPRVIAVLGDDPTRLALDVHPANRHAPSASTPSPRLDQHMSGDETKPCEHLHGRVERVSLKGTYSPALARCWITVHGPTVLGDRLGIGLDVDDRALHPLPRCAPRRLATSPPRAHRYSHRWAPRLDHTPRGQLYLDFNRRVAA